MYLFFILQFIHEACDGVRSTALCYTPRIDMYTFVKTRARDAARRRRTGLG